MMTSTVANPPSTSKGVGISRKGHVDCLSHIGRCSFYICTYAYLGELRLRWLSTIYLNARHDFSRLPEVPERPGPCLKQAVPITAHYVQHIYLSSLSKSFTILTFLHSLPPTSPINQSINKSTTYIQAASDRFPKKQRRGKMTSSTSLLALLTSRTAVDCDTLDVEGKSPYLSLPCIRACIHACVAIEIGITFSSFPSFFSSSILIS